MMTPSALLIRSLKATHSGLGFFIRLSRWSNNGKLHSIRSRISGRSCPLDSIKLWKNSATRWLLRFLRTLEEIIMISAILYRIDFVINLKFWIGGSNLNFHYISNIKVNILNDTVREETFHWNYSLYGKPSRSDYWAKFRFKF